MPDEDDGSDVRHARALFLSDVHLGMRPTRIAQLVDFLRRHEADTIYLIGDIVDGWRLSKSWYWPPLYNEFVEELLGKASGTRMVVLPGQSRRVPAPDLVLDSARSNSFTATPRRGGGPIW